MRLDRLEAAVGSQEQALTDLEARVGQITPEDPAAQTAVDDLAGRVEANNARIAAVAKPAQP